MLIHWNKFHFKIVFTVLHQLIRTKKKLWRQRCRLQLVNEHRIEFKKKKIKILHSAEMFTFCIVINLTVNSRSPMKHQHLYIHSRYIEHTGATLNIHFLCRRGFYSKKL